MSQLPDDLPLSDSQLELLDAYLTQLQNGQAPAREALLRQHPEFAEWLDALEQLEQLALPAGLDDQQTLLESPQITPNSGSSSSAVLTPGRCFGSYELVEEIGRGGMGVVFKARQRGLNRLVALKMILASHLATPEQVSRFQREARAMARIFHGNVVSVHDVGEVEGQYYFAMEFVNGATLAERLATQTYDADAAALLVVKLARAVAHVHAQGIIHRDLKPANVLLAQDGTPKIADFGLARALDDGDDSTRSGVILGTPAYMAPEQAAGKLRQVGPHSDVYSLGAILYEMLTGRPPFRSESALNTLLQVLEQEPERPSHLRPGIPRDLELICLKCLEKEPERRYASAADLAADLERFLAREPIAARADTVVESAQRWFRRDPILVTRILGLVLGAVVLQVNYFLRTDIQPGYHLTVMLLLSGWLVATLLCKQLLRTDPDDVRAVDAGRLLWVGLDVVGMTWIILLGDNEGGPLVVAYALIVTQAGLWFRVHLVWIATLLCELAYLTVILKVYLTTDSIPSKHWVVTFMVVLALIGAVVAWQVQRIHFLTRRWIER